MVGNGGLKSEQNSSGSETSTVPQTREPVSSSFSPFSPWKNNTLGSNDLRTSWNRSNVGFTSVWTCIKIKTITLSQTIAKTSRKTKRTHKPQVDQKTQAPGRDKKPDSSPPPFACRQTPRTKPRGGYNWASATQSYWTFYSHHNSQKTQKNYKLKPKNIALESLKSQKKTKNQQIKPQIPSPLLQNPILITKSRSNQQKSPEKHHLWSQIHKKSEDSTPMSGSRCPPKQEKGTKSKAKTNPKCK